MMTQKECPKCGADMKRVFQEIGDQHYYYETGEVEQDVEIVWECSQCEYTEPDEEIPF